MYIYIYIYISMPHIYASYIYIKLVSEWFSDTQIPKNVIDM